MNMSNTQIKKEINVIKSDLELFRSTGKKLFVSSSFQTHSIPLLHILKCIYPSIPVYFIDTGFHFSETLSFRDEIVDLFRLNLEILTSPISKVHQKDSNGRFYFCSDSEYCCHINKILPLEPILKEKDVWITGVRSDQNFNRKTMKRIMPGVHNTLRYHPMLNWNSKMIWEYRDLYNLPPHPLESAGYLSVGCSPCTMSSFDDRSGRWSGQNKDECGLHVDLVKK